MTIRERIRRWRRRERDLDDEIRSHLAMAGGESARREFGNVALVKEQMREIWGWNRMERAAQDCRYSLRALRKSPAFSLTAIAILGLGIGAAAAIFSIVNALLLRPLPFPEASSIVQVRRKNEFGSSGSFPMHDFLTLRHQQHAFASMTICEWGSGSYNLQGLGDPERVKGMRASAGFFSVFGVRPLAGRLFAESDDIPGRPLLAVLSEGLWRRRFAADPDIAGRTLKLSGVSYTIAGVVPDTLRMVIATDVYLIQPVPEESADRTNGFLVFGRVKNGLSRAQAESQLDTIARRQASSPLTNMAMGLLLPRLQDDLTAHLRPALRVLFVAVCLVLLVACSNVANLVLARGAARAREIAAMSALGAPRNRIVTRLLTESLLLAALGGGAGLLLAGWAIRLLPAFASGFLPSGAAIRLDPWVVLFVILAAGLSGVLSGLVPALQLSKTNLTEALKQGTAQGGGQNKHRLRGVLVASQVALSTMLLVGAALLARSFWKLTAVDAGFRPDHVLTMTISVSAAKYPDSVRVADYCDRVVRNIERLPGVVAASSTSVLPTETDFDFPITPVGARAQKKDDSGLDAQFRAINPHFFTAMGIPLLRGRIFSGDDTGSSAPVVVVSASLARAAFHGEDPLGRALVIGEGYLTAARELRPRTIVGIVGDTRELGLAAPPQMTIYLPAAQSPERITRIQLDKIPSRWVVRTTGNPMEIAGMVRKAVLAADPDQPPADFQSMEQLLSSSIAPNRFNMLLLGIFAALALALAAVGISGLTAYSVSLRRREIGLRMALGARRASVVGWFLWQGGRLCAIGALAGLAGALALARFLRSLLFGVPPADPATLAAVSGVLLITFLFSIYLPASRAAGIDPMTALREE